jgi:hypothetical protein
MQAREPVRRDHLKPLAAATAADMNAAKRSGDWSSQRRASCRIASKVSNAPESLRQVGVGVEVAHHVTFLG